MCINFTISYAIILDNSTVMLILNNSNTNTNYLKASLSCMLVNLLISTYKPVLRYIVNCYLVISHWVKYICLMVILCIYVGSY